MSTTHLPPISDAAEPKPEATPTDQRSRSWIAFGLANFAVVLIVALAGWYLLADPAVSPWHFYPLPFNAALFWAILFVVFIGFNAEFAGFNRLSQPLRGLTITAATILVAVAITWLLSAGLGSIDPDFAADRAGGLGYFTGALFVLFGFGTFVMAVLNWQHWPWPQLGLAQPAVGMAEIAAVAGPTLLLYFVIGLPSVTLGEAHPLLSLETVLGWFYSVIVAVLLTGQSLDNWPWRLAGRPARVALASTIGNLVLGTAIYFVALPLVGILFGARTTEALGSGITQYPAQLGVCWAFWIIFWANAFGNRPTGLGLAANLAIRTVVTFGLGVLTFVLYYRFAAEHVLHEPAVAPGVGGNALGFMDWMVLVTLFYVVAFESIGLRRWAGPTA
jgi:AAT family amino acid transporter